MTKIKESVETINTQNLIDIVNNSDYNFSLLNKKNNTVTASSEEVSDLGFTAGFGISKQGHEVRYTGILIKSEDVISIADYLDNCFDTNIRRSLHTFVTKNNELIVLMKFAKSVFNYGAKFNITSKGIFNNVKYTLNVIENDVTVNITPHNHHQNINKDFFNDYQQHYFLLEEFKNITDTFNSLNGKTSDDVLKLKNKSGLLNLYTPSVNSFATRFFGNDRQFPPINVKDTDFSLNKGVDAQLKENRVKHTDDGEKVSESQNKAEVEAYNAEMKKRFELYHKDLYKFVNDLVEVGLNPIPVNRAKKTPVSELHSWSEYQQNKIDERVLDIFKNSESSKVGVALICGSSYQNVNGEKYYLECIDFDNINKGIKSWYENEDSKDFLRIDNVIEEYINRVEKINPSLIDKLVIEKSRNGGYHIFYLAKNASAGEKLAHKKYSNFKFRSKGEEITDTERYVYDDYHYKSEKNKSGFIETRGIGNYIIVYNEYLKQKDKKVKTIFDVECIDDDDRNTLIEIAKGFNEVTKDCYINNEDSNLNNVRIRSGDKIYKSIDDYKDSLKNDTEAAYDIYNRMPDINELKNALLNDGWSKVREDNNKIYFRRPGKTGNSVSATLFKESGIFYNHSTNVANLEAGTAYSPSALRAILLFYKNNRDLKEAFRENTLDLVSKGYGEKYKTKEEYRAEYKAKKIAEKELKEAEILASKIEAVKNISTDENINVTDDEISMLTKQWREISDSGDINRKKELKEIEKKLDKELKRFSFQRRGEEGINVGELYIPAEILFFRKNFKKNDGEIDYFVEIIPDKIKDFLMFIGIKTFITNDSKRIPVLVKNQIVYNLSNVEDFNRAVNLKGFVLDKGRSIEDSAEAVIEFLKHFILNLPASFDENISSNDIVNSWIGYDFKKYINRTFPLLDRVTLSDFLRDTPNSMFFPFKNCIVEIKRVDDDVYKYEDIQDYIIKRDYNEINKYVWNTHKIKWNYEIKGESRHLYNSNMFNSMTALFFSAVCSTNKDFVYMKNDDVIKSNIPIAEKFNDILKVDKNKLKSLMCGVGYTLHNYSIKAGKAVIFNDRKIGETLKDNNGRTGKSLIVKMLSFLRNTQTIDGRRFDEKYNFAVSIKDDTQILQFDDIEHDFNFTYLYSSITDGWKFHVKYSKNEVCIPLEYSPKNILTTNTILRQDDESSRDRRYEIDFSDFFSSSFNPSMYFKKYDILVKAHTDLDMYVLSDKKSVEHDKYSLLKAGWGDLEDETPNTDEWNSFFTYMFICAKEYLQNDLPLNASPENELKRLVANCGIELVDFFDEYLYGNEVVPITYFYRMFVEKSEIGGFSLIKGDRNYKATWFGKRLVDYLKYKNIPYMKLRKIEIVDDFIYKNQELQGYYINWKNNGIPENLTLNSRVKFLTKDTVFRDDSLDGFIEMEEIKSFRSNINSNN